MVSLGLETPQEGLVTVIGEKGTLHLDGKSQVNLLGQGDPRVLPQESIAGGSLATPSTSSRGGSRKAPTKDLRRRAHQEPGGHAGCGGVVSPWAFRGDSRTREFPADIDGRTRHAQHRGLTVIARMGGGRCSRLPPSFSDYLGACRRKNLQREQIPSPGSVGIRYSAGMKPSSRTRPISCCCCPRPCRTGCRRITSRGSSAT